MTALPESGAQPDGYLRKRWLFRDIASPLSDLHGTYKGHEGWAHCSCELAIILRRIDEASVDASAQSCTLEKIEAMRDALKAIASALHDDKGSYHLARAYLDKHGRYHGNLDGERVLLEVAELAILREELGGGE